MEKSAEQSEKQSLFSPQPSPQKLDENKSGSELESSTVGKRSDPSANRGGEASNVSVHSEAMSVSNYEDSGVGNSVGHNGCNSSCTLDSISSPPISPNYQVHFQQAQRHQQTSGTLVVPSGGSSSQAQQRPQGIQVQSRQPAGEVPRGGQGSSSGAAGKPDVAKTRSENIHSGGVHPSQEQQKLIANNQFCPIFSPTPSVTSSVMEPLHVDTSMVAASSNSGKAEFTASKFNVEAIGKGFQSGAIITTIEVSFF